MSEAKQLPLLTRPTDEDAAVRVGRATFAALMEHRRGNPDYKMTEAALIEAIRPSLARELPKPKRINKRNPLFDAIAHGFGHNGNITRAAAGTVAMALKQILEVDPAASTEDLARGCAYVRRKFESAGPMALASHWHEITKRSAERTKAARNDIYQEPPPGWREAARKRFPDALDWGNSHNFSTMAWADVATAIRPDILKALHTP